MNIKQLTLMAALGLSLSLSACGGKDDKGGDKAKDTSKAKSEAKVEEKSGPKAVDNAKYQASVKALNPLFALEKTPIKIGYTQQEGTNMFMDSKDIAENLIIKHLNHDKKTTQGSGAGIMGIQTLARFEGPDGDMRFLVNFLAPMGSEARLYTFDPEAEKWVNLLVSSQDGDGENNKMLACEIKTDGSIELVKWESTFDIPGDPETEKVSKKQKSTLNFKGGKWQ